MIAQITKAAIIKKYGAPKIVNNLTYKGWIDKLFFPNSKNLKILKLPSGKTFAFHVYISKFAKKFKFLNSKKTPPF